jgi:hypothetical protein
MSDSVPVGAVPDVWDNVGPSVPNSARMYDYYLGGKDNFPVDREAAEKAVAAMPAIPVLARANRAFLVDSVGKMAAAGVSQFLDIGSGLPTSPNVHEVARQTVPDARVVYVDYDPVVVLHSQAKRRVPGDVGAAFRRGHHRPAGGPVHGPARARQLPGAVACGHRRRRRVRVDGGPGGVRGVTDRPGDPEHRRDPGAVHGLRDAAARPHGRSPTRRSRTRPRTPRRAFGCSAPPAASCRRLDWVSARSRR